MGFKYKSSNYKDRIRSRGYEKMEKKRKDRIRVYEAVGTKRLGRLSDYGGDDYETMGTKRKDRIRGYGVNDSEMYSQWYQHFDDNFTQAKSRRGFRSSSKDDDYLQGGKGRDKLRGGKGDDELQGQRGHDHLRGCKGDDYLIGGEGNDSLKGGKGDDILIGGKGKDKLIGGKEADIFAVKSDTEKGSKCIIKDFNPDEGDKISAADKVSIEMKGDKAIIEADGATTICKFDSDYRPNKDPFLPWFTDPTSTGDKAIIIVDVVES